MTEVEHIMSTAKQKWNSQKECKYSSEQSLKIFKYEQEYMKEGEYQMVHILVVNTTGKVM